MKHSLPTTLSKNRYYLTGLVLIGLIVLPVSAKQSNADLLLEVRLMRQEIADLRDMIEVQAYQLERLKNQLAETTPDLLTETQQNVDSNSPILGSNASVISQDNNQLIGDPPSSQVVVSQPSFSFESETAQSADAENTPQETIEGGTVIVDREITAPPPIATAGRAYPEVEERQVLGNRVEQNVPQQTQIEARAVGSNRSVDGMVNEPLVNQQAVSQDQIAEEVDAVLVEPRQATEEVVGDTVPVQKRADNSVSANLNRPNISESEYYQQGFTLLQQSQYDQAAELFKQQIADYPQGELADDAHYWVAESLYVNRFLGESKKYFKTIISQFPNSSRVPDAMLKTAYIEQEQGNNTQARILLQDIIQFHPRSNAAISAKNRLEGL